MAERADKTPEELEQSPTESGPEIISPGELEEMLDHHRIWVESEGKDGQRADFQRAVLHDAYLQGADLRGANFCQANLLGAELQNANLQGADFSEAHLHKASLQGATLRSANFEGASLFRPICRKRTCVRLTCGEPI